MNVRGHRREELPEAQAAHHRGSREGWKRGAVGGATGRPRAPVVSAATSRRLRARLHRARCRVRGRDAERAHRGRDPADDDGCRSVARSRRRPISRGPHGAGAGAGRRPRHDGRASASSEEPEASASASFRTAIVTASATRDIELRDRPADRGGRRAVGSVSRRRHRARRRTCPAAMPCSSVEPTFSRSRHTARRRPARSTSAAATARSGSSAFSASRGDARVLRYVPATGEWVECLLSDTERRRAVRRRPAAGRDTGARQAAHGTRAGRRRHLASARSSKGARDCCRARTSTSTS